MTKEAIVVVEIVPTYSADMDNLIFLRENNEFFDGWFHFPPKATAKILRSMGFGRSEVTYHKQLMQLTGDTLVDLYTLVAYCD